MRPDFYHFVYRLDITMRSIHTYFSILRGRVTLRLAVVAVLAAVMISIPSALAQEFRGTFSGKVTDTTGAVIPGAQVTVTEMNTGTVNKTVTDAAGEYVIPFLLPGTYTIRATAAGFLAGGSCPVVRRAMLAAV